MLECEDYGAQIGFKVRRTSGILPVMAYFFFFCGLKVSNLLMISLTFLNKMMFWPQIIINLLSVFGYQIVK